MPRVTCEGSRGAIFPRISRRRLQLGCLELPIRPRARSRGGTSATGRPPPSHCAEQRRDSGRQQERNYFGHVNGRPRPMLPTTGFLEEDDCGINYFWSRLPQTSPPSRTGWMVISQTLQPYVYCIHWLETLPSIFENSSRGMLVQDLMPFTLSFWPFFLGHCLLSLFLLSCQVRKGSRIYA